MTTTATPIGEHPAKWSQRVLVGIATIVDEHLPDEPVVLDPFAGVGRARLADTIRRHRPAALVYGIDIQPEWCADTMTIIGDATRVPSGDGTYDAVITSPCYGNRLADHHQAEDACTICEGFGVNPVTDERCIACKGSGLSWRSTYAHTLRRHGRDIAPGSAATLQWGAAYRRLHRDAIREMIRVVAESGLLVVNMSNHIRRGGEQPVVEWWLHELMAAGCSLVEAVRIPTPRNRRGANHAVRVAGEMLLVVRTPAVRAML